MTDFTNSEVERRNADEMARDAHLKVASRPRNKVEFPKMKSAPVVDMPDTVTLAHKVRADNDEQLRENIEETLRSEFASVLETELETQEETLRAEFEEKLPEMLETYEARRWEDFEEIVDEAIEERLQAYLDSVEDTAA